MRSPSCSTSLIGWSFHSAFAQGVTERDAFVEHETLTAPAAFGCRYLFQVFKDAALEVIDLGKTARQKQRAGILAADAAGAEHRDLPVPRRIKCLRGKLLELPKAFDAGIECAFEGAHRKFERIRSVDHERIRRCDPRVPLSRLRL